MFLPCAVRNNAFTSAISFSGAFSWFVVTMSTRFCGFCAAEGGGRVRGGARFGISLFLFLFLFVLMVLVVVVVTERVVAVLLLCCFSSHPLHLRSTQR